MATRDEIKTRIAYMGMAFPNYHPELEWNVTAVDVMLDLLGDLDIGTLRTALRHCCSQSGRSFAPSPGEIRGAVAELQARASGTPTAGEAWGAIMESFRHTSFDQPAALHHPLIQEAIRCMGGLDVIGASENVMAERAHFLKIYEQLYQRALADEVMLPEIADAIGAPRRLEDSIKMLADKMARKVEA